MSSGGTFRRCRQFHWKQWNLNVTPAHLGKSTYITQAWMLQVSRTSCSSPSFNVPSLTVVSSTPQKFNRNASLRPWSVLIFFVRLSQVWERLPSSSSQSWISSPKTLSHAPPLSFVTTESWPIRSTRSLLDSPRTSLISEPRLSLVVSPSTSILNSWREWSPLMLL